MYLKNVLLKTLSLFLIFISIYLQAFTQTKVFESREKAREAIRGSVYIASNGWKFHKGSFVKLGTGSLPDKKFAFILEESNRILDEKHYRFFREQLEHSYSGRNIGIANFLVAGNKTSGFRVLAKVKVGKITRYIMDIERAIEAGELLAPDEVKTVAGNK